MDYNIIPMGTATGRAWQYRLERDGQFTAWSEWSAELRLTTDPDGQPLRIQTQYWLHARNPNITPFAEGSLENELACPCYITASGRVVTGKVEAPDVQTDTVQTYSLTPTDSATGPGWQYELARGENATGWVNWSDSLEIDKDPDGNNIRTGVLYWLSARNPNITPYEPGSPESPFVCGIEISPSGNVASVRSNITADIIPTLDQVARTGDLSVRGFTDQLLRLMGGLFLDKIPVTTDDLPTLLIDANGQVKKSAALRPDTWEIIEHYEEVDIVVVDTIYAEVNRALFTPDNTNPTATGIYRIIDAAHTEVLEVEEGTSLQLVLEEQLSDGTWVASSYATTWSLLGTLPGVSITAGLVTAAVNSVNNDTTIGVNATIPGSFTQTGVIIKNSVPIVDTNNPPVITATSWHWNEFTSGGGTNPDNWPIGYITTGGTWNFGTNGTVCQQDTNRWMGSTVFFTSNGSQNSLGRNYSIAKVKPQGLNNTGSWIGVGVQFGQGGDYELGFSLLIKSSTEVSLLHNGNAFLVTVPFNTQNGVWYWMKIIAEHTGTNQTRLTGKIWVAGTVEPTANTVDYTVSTRLTGYPGIFGGSNGATACFGYWGDGNQNTVINTAVGSAAINIVMPNVAECSLVLTTSGFTETGTEVFAVADNARRFSGGTNPENSLFLASSGYTTTSGLGYYSFAFAISQFRTRYPSATVASFDVYVRPPVVSPAYISRVNYSYQVSGGLKMKTLSNGLDFEYQNPQSSVDGFWAYEAGTDVGQQNTSSNLHSQFTITGNIKKKIGTMTINLVSGVSLFQPVA